MQPNESFKYLKGISKLRLFFGDWNTILEGYTNANMVGDPDHRKSYLFSFARELYLSSPNCKKCVALPTTKTKYIATVEVRKEKIWLKSSSRIGYEAKGKCSLLL